MGKKSRNILFLLTKDRNYRLGHLPRYLANRKKSGGCSWNPNSSLDGNARRAIDIHEGEEVDAGAFKALIRAAVALNTSGGKARPRRAK
jgi:hypothetical protein